MKNKIILIILSSFALIACNSKKENNEDIEELVYKAKIQVPNDVKDKFQLADTLVTSDTMLIQNTRLKIVAKILHKDIHSFITEILFYNINKNNDGKLKFNIDTSSIVFMNGDTLFNIISNEINYISKTVEDNRLVYIYSYGDILKDIEMNEPTTKKVELEQFKSSSSKYNQLISNITSSELYKLAYKTPNAENCKYAMDFIINKASTVDYFNSFDSLTRKTLKNYENILLEIGDVTMEKNKETSIQSAGLKLKNEFKDLVIHGYLSNEALKKNIDTLTSLVINITIPVVPKIK